MWAISVQDIEFATHHLQLLALEVPLLGGEDGSFLLMEKNVETSSSIILCIASLIRSQ
jgi:hypothetical protein